jgi:hypothetical protein
MPSLTAKVIHGKTYYYARECKRVGGKPKIVRTIYLGSLDNILNAVQQAKQPVQHQSVDIAAFGDVVALWDLAEQIGLVDIINRHVPTYLDTNNPTELAERGHNKQKRNDLRQVSLGMMVSTDFHVPLFHKVYAGNVTDSVIFKTVSEELRARYVELARDYEHVEGKRMAGKEMGTESGRRKFEPKCRFEDARSSFAQKTIPLPNIRLPDCLTRCGRQKWTGVLLLRTSVFSTLLLRQHAS